MMIRAIAPTELPRGKRRAKDAGRTMRQVFVCNCGRARLYLRTIMTNAGGQSAFAAGAAEAIQPGDSLYLLPGNGLLLSLLLI